MELERVAQLLKESGNIVLMPHISADGDAIGSSIALAAALQKMGKKASVLMEEEIPFIYGFLPGKELCGVYERGSLHFDTAVALDTGDLARLGLRSSILQGARISINIDHHNTNSEYAFHNYIDSHSSAVGEIVYDLIRLIGVELDKDMATCLYVAISTDTGGFRFSNTTSKTHRIAAELIDKGVDVAEVSRMVFDTTSYEKVKLTAAAVNSLELLERGKVAFMTVTDEAFRQSGAKDEDFDGIINTARNVRGVEVAALLSQRSSGEVKVNLRSNQYVDVSKIASLFSGGGHKRAAGFTVKDSLEAVRKQLLEDIKEEL